MKKLNKGQMLSNPTISPALLVQFRIVVTKALAVRHSLVCTTIKNMVCPFPDLCRGYFLNDHLTETSHLKTAYFIKVHHSHFHDLFSASLIIIVARHYHQQSFFLLNNMTICTMHGAESNPSHLGSAFQLLHLHSLLYYNYFLSSIICPNHLKQVLIFSIRE